ncbi:MAG: DUF2130 domain-containing protein [Bacteroidota bacterium]|nr:DUF2130 domain-containing protein [Bacteroidota bacterium]
MSKSTITCPNCKHEFEATDALRDEVQKELNLKAKEWIQKREEDFKRKEEDFNAKLNNALIVQKKMIEEQAIKKAASEMEVQVKFLNNEITEKDKKLKESQEKELELLKKEKLIKEREESLKLDLEKQLLEREKEIFERAQKVEAEKSQLKLRELEKKIADQNELVETMKRKAEQGSMQLQGEVQELALEELLRLTFPFDSIEEVAKGVKGADCVQIVRNNIANECGKIIYESKRTKAFTNEWIEKLKSDMRSQQADIAVIVTETLPKDMDSFGFKDGVWICKFSDVKPLSFLLRDSLIKINTAIASQENKTDKMQLLYNFLTGNEFKQSMEAIGEGYIALREGIIKEKIQMEKIWKEREKQLDKVLLNTSQFYGSIQGIAGSAVGDLKMLE